MIDRVNRLHTKIAAVTALVQIPELTDVLKLVPDHVDASTTIPADLPDKLADATKQFAAKNDGSRLGAIDTLIPKVYMGKVYKE
jgi:hypothetical protein